MQKTTKTMQKLKPLTKKERKRLYELEDEAVNNFLEHSDFNADDWLDDEDQKEFRSLFDREYGILI